MCGIVAVQLADETSQVGQLLVDGLTVLQHRGQDAAGIVVCDKKGRLNLRKDHGLVSEVFQQRHMDRLRGHMGLGHVRYPTAGTSSCAEAQPLFTNYPYGICAAHNGNLINTEELKESVQESLRHVNTGSDSELLLNILAEELQKKRTKNIKPDDVFEAVRGVMKKCKGGYGVVVLITGVGILGIRDPHGIRPLVMGKRPSVTLSSRYDYIFASESVAIDTLHFELERDVAPGEAQLITADGTLYTAPCAEKPVLRPCIFEYVYFARPDSVLDGVPVYQARLNMGEELAKRIIQLRPDHDIDVVIPVPDTSRTSALQLAYTLNRPYREGFIKNRYIARTFIMPGQAVRTKTVRMKLNTIKSEFKGKTVLLVDDSIVRGTTSRELVTMAREAGAKRVYMTSAAPPVRYPNVYGIDIPTHTELIAYERDEDEVAKELGADWVVYQDLPGLLNSVTRVNPELTVFDASCFDGVYVTGGVTDGYLNGLQKGRGYKQAKLAGTSGPANGHVSGGPHHEQRRSRLLSDESRGAGECESLYNDPRGCT